MSGGITLKEVNPSTIIVPASGKDTIFIDSTVVPPAPAYKDSSGTTRSMLGSTGATGAQGPLGPVVLVSDGIDGNDGFTVVSFPTTQQNTRQIGITIDGSGSAITTGVKGYRSFPVSGLITGVRLLADQAGDVVIDIWKDTYANYPPTVADTITASAKPTLSTAASYNDTTLTGWTKSIVAGDVFGFNVDSVATITRLTLELTIVI